MQDRQSLEAYLERLAVVLAKLEATTKMLLTGCDDPGPPPPASISVGDVKPKKGGGKQSQAKQDMLISAKNAAETKRVVDCRLKQQRGEVVDMLGALGIKFSSIVNMQVLFCFVYVCHFMFHIIMCDASLFSRAQVSIHSSICYAMQTDSSTSNNTRHLFPSEHLSDAVYAPEEYLAQMAASDGVSSSGMSFFSSQCDRKKRASTATVRATKRAVFPSGVAAAAAFTAVMQGQQVRHHDSGAETGVAVDSVDAFAATVTNSVDAVAATVTTHHPVQQQETEDTAMENDGFIASIFVNSQDAAI